MSVTLAVLHALKLTLADTLGLSVAVEQKEPLRVPEALTELDGLPEVLMDTVSVPVEHCEAVVEAEEQVLGDAVGEVPPEAV